MSDANNERPNTVKMIVGHIIAAYILAGILSATAQSSAPVVDDKAADTRDESREVRGHATIPDRIQEILDLAKASAEKDGNVDFYGFFTGMSRSDAAALVKYYGLGASDCSVSSRDENAVWKINFSHKGIRLVSKCGDSRDESFRAVTNRVARLRQTGMSCFRYTTRNRAEVHFHPMTNLSIQQDNVKDEMPIETAMAKSERVKRQEVLEKEQAEERRRIDRELEAQAERLGNAVSDLVKNMVPIPEKDYALGKFEVTQLEWRAVMGKNPDEFMGNDFPVDCVSWSDCRSFLKKLNALPEVKERGLVFRLPTDQEWEDAALAGGRKRSYCKLADGTSITSKTLGKVAWFRDNSDSKPHPVGQKEPNAFGLHDVYGNVSEWTRRVEKKSDKKTQIVRGGNYFSTWNSCYMGYRSTKSRRGDHGDGFRLARTLTPLELEERAKSEARRHEDALSDLVRNMVAIPGKGYAMGKYEVTQLEWKAVMGMNPAEFACEENPVERVSWNDCQTFLAKLNEMPAVKASGLIFRLPTQEEWEYACRAGATDGCCKLEDGTLITKDTLGDVAWYYDNSGDKMHPVGRKKPNAFGLHDTYGNVLEWTQTEVKPDRGSREKKMRICGMGYWSGYYDSDFSRQGSGELSHKSSGVGLRLASTLPK